MPAQIKRRGRRAQPGRVRRCPIRRSRRRPIWFAEHMAIRL